MLLLLGHRCDVSFPPVQCYQHAALSSSDNSHEQATHCGAIVLSWPKQVPRTFTICIATTWVWFLNVTTNQQVYNIKEPLMCRGMTVLPPNVIPCCYVLLCRLPGQRMELSSTEETKLEVLSPAVLIKCSHTTLFITQSNTASSD